eukprot:TRINITY_DN122801_c0_g1_i1.p1 TRINITY_DN122801_c0_g1~~TRINITY_DN122801_c0_g1_i1.p1  ORF type:complete len:238 (-),score=31.25 TRINITY_DN122801_c0_g1_i1:117-830(-)
MSFGQYRPTMGVAGGHRELSSHQSVGELRRQSEYMRRQEYNPITGESNGAGGAASSSGAGRPPSGNLATGLVPTKGPSGGYVTVPDRDVPQKRVDPTKNQSCSFGSGNSLVPLPSQDPVRSNSRLTEGNLASGFSIRESTPERRRSPGEVVRGGIRPKDNLQHGCMVFDKQDPVGLPRKPGSCGYGVGSGGAGNLEQGAMGFVPRGAPDPYADDVQVGNRDMTAVPFRRACGAAIAR